MLLLPDTMIAILSAGGGLTVDQGMLLPDNLVAMAAAARKGGGTLTIKNIKLLLPDNMLAIARAGAGHVVFDVT